MGVMPCSRKGCDNILCDKHSSVYGYICDECFEELCNLGIETDIASFLETEPYYRDTGEDPRDYFGRIFIDQREDNWFD